MFEIHFKCPYDHFWHENLVFLAVFRYFSQKFSGQIGHMTIFVMKIPSIWILSPKFAFFHHFRPEYFYDIKLSLNRSKNISNFCVRRWIFEYKNCNFGVNRLFFGELKLKITITFAFWRVSLWIFGFVSRKKILLKKRMKIEFGSLLVQKGENFTQRKFWLSELNCSFIFSWFKPNNLIIEQSL